MLRSQAKALGLKVYRGMTPCRVSSKHGYLRLTHSNKCAACGQQVREREADLRATQLDKLRAEVERKLRREMAAQLTQAHKQAQDILKDARREAMDKARMLEKAHATRAVRKAATEAPRAPTGPVVVPQFQDGGDPEAAPWD
jgi:uncharacterized protein YlxW (UPF0749 family)